MVDRRNYLTNFQEIADALAAALVPSNDSITDAMLRNSGALSVIGRSANTSGDPGDISASSDDTVLRRVSDALSFGQLTADMAPNDIWTYAKIQNVSATDRLLGRSTAGAGDIEEITCTSAARDLLDDADAGAQRATLGLGTTDNPQFASLNLGHASDTTITRAAAGEIDVEGSRVYQRSNILGTVSESSGVPTGAVIERGSNAKGEYVRLADGMQICTTSAAGTKDAASATGNLFNSATVSTWTFPAAFASGVVPVCSGAAQSSARAIIFGAPSNTSVNFRHWATTSQASVVETSITAIGRWF